MSVELGQGGTLPSGTTNPITIPSQEAPQKQLKQDEKLNVSGEQTVIQGSYKVLATQSDTVPGYLSDKIYTGQFSIISNEIRLTSFGTLTTDSLAEGSTNLYLNSTNFDALLATKTTDNLPQGSINKYFTTANFDATLALKTSDDLTQGSTNLYLTSAERSGIAENTAARHTHVNKAVLDAITNAGSGQIMTDAERTKLAGIEDGAGSNTVLSVNTKTGNVILYTDDISEDGSPVNLWFTNARAQSALAGHTGDSSIHFSDLSSFSTSGLSEGTNLYYTEARVNANTNVSANTAARHTHPNKALLDTYTQSNAAIVSAVTNDHTHANKAILDATQESFTTALKDQYDALVAGTITTIQAPLDLTLGVLSHDDSDGNKHVPSNSAASQYYVLASGASAGSYSWVSIDDVVTNQSTIFEATPTTATDKGVQSAYVNTHVANGTTDVKHLTDAQLTSVTTTFPNHIADALIHLPSIAPGTDQGKFLFVNASDQPEWTESNANITVSGQDYISASGTVITANKIRFIHTDFIAGSNITIDTGTDTISATWRGIDQTPVNGQTAESISSAWAYTHSTTTGNEGHVPAVGTSGYFLAWDGTFKDVSEYVNIEILDFVLAMQEDNTLDPGLTPTTGDRYILLDTSNLNANFGTITGVGDNDIVEYDGANFVVSFDSSAATASITVTVTTDINGNPDREWYYSVSGIEWRDRGISGSVYWTRDDINGRVSPSTSSDDILLDTASKVSWGTGSSYIEESATNIIDFGTASTLRFQISTTVVNSVLPIAVNTINEYTAATGVTIDGVLLKDNNVQATQFHVEGSGTSITKDGSNNMVFTDAVAGAVILNDIATEAYADSHINSKTTTVLDALNTNTGPGAAEDGYVLTWSNADSEYILTAVSGGGGDLWSDPVDASIIPDIDDTYDIGNTTKAFSDIYITGIIKNGTTTIFQAATDETWIGYGAGNAATTGINNVGIGRSVGLSITTGSENTMAGAYAGDAVTEGFRNSLFGYRAGSAITTGDDNTFFGTDSGLASTGDRNTYLGSKTGFTATTAIGNVFVGYYAGYYETGSNTLFIDNQNRTNEATARTNSLVYGTFNTTPASQVFRVNAALQLPHIASGSESNMLYYNSTTGNVVYSDAIVSGNGTTISSGNVNLGGSLTGDITIDTDGIHEFILTSPLDDTKVYSEGLSLTVEEISSGFRSSLQYQGLLTNDGTNTAFIQRLSGSAQYFTVSAPAYAAFQGMSYGGDYSALNASNPRWLTDKEYVDSLVAGGGGIGSIDANGNYEFSPSGITFNATYHNNNIILNPDGEAIGTPTAATDYNFMVFNGMTTFNGANYNVGIGRHTLGSLTTGDYNVAIGYEVGNALTTPLDNVMIGRNVCNDLTDMRYNVMLGNNIMDQVTPDALPQTNVMIGYNIADSIKSTGTVAVTNNILIGDNILNGGSETSFDLRHNIGIGDQIFNAVTDRASFNIALGYITQNSVTTGDYNISLGYNAAFGLTTGSDTIAIGRYSGRAVTTGNNNIGIGEEALGSSGVAGACTGGLNIALGTNMLARLTTGGNNIFLGDSSGAYLSTGLRNISLGTSNFNNSLLSSASDNILLGYNADNGAIQTSNYNILIGRYSGATVAGASSNGILSIGAYATSSNTPIITGVMGTLASQTLKLNASVNYYTGSLTDGAPTNAEINSIITSSYGAGYQAIIKDTDGSGAMYKVAYDGTGWHYIQMTAAV